MSVLLSIFMAAALSFQPAERTTAPGGLPPEKVEKFRKMSPEERQKLRERWEKFKALPAEDREKILQNVERLRKMNPDALRGLQRRLKDLPEEKRAAFHRMMKRAEIPPFMIPRLMQWLRRNFPEDGLEKFLNLPAPQQREAFGQIVGRFKKETIRGLVQKRIVPKLFADVMKDRPLSDQWRMAIDCLREHRERSRKMGLPSEDDSKRPSHER